MHFKKVQIKWSKYNKLTNQGSVSVGFVQIFLWIFLDKPFHPPSLENNWRISNGSLISPYPPSLSRYLKYDMSWLYIYIINMSVAYTAVWTKLCWIIFWKFIISAQYFKIETCNLDRQPANQSHSFISFSVSDLLIKY